MSYTMLFSILPLLDIFDFLFYAIRNIFLLYFQLMKLVEIEHGTKFLPRTSFLQQLSSIIRFLLREL